MRPKATLRVITGIQPAQQHPCILSVAIDLLLPSYQGLDSLPQPAIDPVSTKPSEQ